MAQSQTSTTELVHVGFGNFLAVNKVLASPDVIERISAGGVSVAGGTQEEFAALVRNDYARWGQTVKESGIKLD
jgi:tripartite-type tricarboxylate transporter receptor subunit TctC